MKYLTKKKKVTENISTNPKQRRKFQLINKDFIKNNQNNNNVSVNPNL